MTTIPSKTIVWCHRCQAQNTAFDNTPAVCPICGYADTVVSTKVLAYPADGYIVAEFFGWGSNADAAEKGYKWLTNPTNGWVSVGYGHQSGREFFVPKGQESRFSGTSSAMLMY